MFEFDTLLTYGNVNVIVFSPDEKVNMEQEESTVSLGRIGDASPLAVKLG